MAKRFFGKRMLISGMQYRLLLGNLLYLAAVVLLFLGALVLPVVLNLFNEDLDPNLRNQAARELLMLHERVWYAVPVIVVLCVFHSILVSHRIAGPLHRFRRIFADIGSGDLTMHVRVRRTDYLRPEADIMTDMIRSMADKMTAIQASHAQVGETLPELMKVVGEHGDKDAAVLAGKLGTQMDRLGRQIRQFQVPGVDDPVRPRGTDTLKAENEELSRISF